MKKQYLFGVLYSLVVLFLGCSSGNQSDASESGVKKTIKTRAYTLKANFDELSFDQPIFEMGFHNILGDIADEVWTIQYFDKNNNILKIEHIRLDDDGKERIYMTTINEYFSFEKGLLSLVKTESDFAGTFGKKYIRNENGDLLEVSSFRGKQEVTEKVKYTYNSSRQLIKEEIYEENGLVESIEYTYDSHQDDLGRLIKKETKNFKNDYRRETEYKLSDDGTVNKKRSQYYQDGSLYSDFTTIYDNYIGEIATREIQEGFSGPTLVSENANGTKSEYGGGFKRTLIAKELDDRGNVKKQIEEGLNPADKPALMGSNDGIYEMEYTYNEKNEISQLIFTSAYSKSVIIRDIEYFN